MSESKIKLPPVPPEKKIPVASFWPVGNTEAASWECQTGEVSARIPMKEISNMSKDL